MSKDRREDEGQYYPGGSVVPRGPVTPGGGGGTPADYSTVRNNANTGATHAATTGNPHQTSYDSLTGKPNLAAVATSGSYNDLSKKPDIPTTLSDLSGDETHRTVTDEEKAGWNRKQVALTTAQLANIDAVPQKRDKTDMFTEWVIVWDGSDTPKSWHIVYDGPEMTWRLFDGEEEIATSTESDETLTLNFGKKDGRDITATRSRILTTADVTDDLTNPTEGKAAEAAAVKTAIGNATKLTPVLGEWTVSPDSPQMGYLTTPARLFVNEYGEVGCEATVKTGGTFTGVPDRRIPVSEIDTVTEFSTMGCVFVRSIVGYKLGDKTAETDPTLNGMSADDITKLVVDATKDKRDKSDLDVSTSIRAWDFGPWLEKMPSFPATRAVFFVIEAGGVWYKMCAIDGDYSQMVGMHNATFQTKEEAEAYESFTPTNTGFVYGALEGVTISIRNIETTDRLALASEVPTDNKITELAEAACADNPSASVASLEGRVVPCVSGASGTVDVSFAARKDGDTTLRFFDVLIKDVPSGGCQINLPPTESFIYGNALKAEEGWNHYSFAEFKDGDTYKWAVNRVKMSTSQS